MVNKELVADSFVPNVVVTLEHAPATGVTPQQVLDRQRVGLSHAGVTDMTVTPGQNCGSTAETVNYTLPAQGGVAAHAAMVLLVAPSYGGNDWSATGTVQTMDANDPMYQQDSSTILSGFQMIPSGT